MTATLEAALHVARELTEIGGVVPVKGLYVLDAAYDDPSAYTHSLEPARPATTAILDSTAGATS